VNTNRAVFASFVLLTELVMIDLLRGLVKTAKAKISDKLIGEKR
jgi:hypothetical protein